MRQSVREAEAGQALHGGQGGQAGQGGHCGHGGQGGYSGQAASRKKVCLHFFVGVSRKTSNCTGCSTNFQHSQTSSTRFEKEALMLKMGSVMFASHCDWIEYWLEIERWHCDQEQTRSTQRLWRGVGRSCASVFRWENIFTCFFVVLVFGTIPIFQAKIRMMLAQKETIEKELAKLQVVVHTNYLPYHN